MSYSIQYDIHKAEVPPMNSVTGKLPCSTYNRSINWSYCQNSSYRVKIVEYNQNPLIHAYLGFMLS
jgi:hypothetical protein